MPSVQTLLTASRTKRRQKTESTKEYLARLTHIALEERGITDLANMGLVKHATTVYLQSNALTSSSGISACPRITHLYLQDNSLTSLDELGALPSLTVLHVASNALSSLAGLEACTSLQALHIQHQKSADPAAPARPLGLESHVLEALAPSLRILNVSGNMLRSLAPLGVLTALSTLSARDNNVTSLPDVTGAISDMHSLRHLDVRDNKGLGKSLRYRREIIVAAPSLTSVDERPVKSNERQFALNWAAKRRAPSARASSRPRLSRASSRASRASSANDDYYRPPPGMSLEGASARTLASPSSRGSRQRQTPSGVSAAGSLGSLPARPSRAASQASSRASSRASGYHNTSSRGSIRAPPPSSLASAEAYYGTPWLGKPPSHSNADPAPVPDQYRTPTYNPLPTFEPQRGRPNLYYRR